MQNICHWSTKYVFKHLNLKVSKHRIGLHQRNIRTGSWINFGSKQIIRSPKLCYTSSLNSQLDRSYYHGYSHNQYQSIKFIFPMETIIFRNSYLLNVRLLTTSNYMRDKETLKPSSQVEVTVQDIKEKTKSTKSISNQTAPVKIVPKKSLGLRIKEEILHYYHGFKLLFIDIRIGTKYAWRILNGETLSRREHRQLIRTTGDLFRLLPFSVFIIVPFMEFLLPVALKLFPGMLPSTFETINEKEAKMKKKLKVKLEMAKFLQQTLDTMSLEGRGHHSQSAKEFVEFFEKIHKTGEVVSNEEILKFSKLFEDEITLDSLERPQLMAICRLLEMQPFGTNNFLRFQLRMKLRNLVADDRIIENEGANSLAVWELQQACRARGMRAYGLSKERLRHQLKQWLALSLDEKVPPSLLLLSRTLYLPENVAPEETLAATISTLPEEVATRTKAFIGKKEGKIDNVTKFEIIKNEEKKIEQDKEEIQKEQDEKKIRGETAKKKQAEITAEEFAAQLIGRKATPDIHIMSPEALAKAALEAIQDPNKISVKEELHDIAPMIDKAPVIESGTHIEEELIGETELTPEDIDHVEEALEMVELSKKKLFIEESELSELKSEIADYEEDIRDLEETIVKAGIEKSSLKESKAARRLYSRVNKMVTKMDTLMNALDQERESLQKQMTNIPEKEDHKSEDLINIEELISHLKMIVSVTDSSKIEVMRTVLDKMDADMDGAIKAEHVLKVLELLSEDQHGMSKKMLEEVVEMISKEEQLEMQSLIHKTLRLPSVKTKHSLPDQHDSPPIETLPKYSTKDVSSQKENVSSQIHDLAGSKKTNTTSESRQEK